MPNLPPPPGTRPLEKGTPKFNAKDFEKNGSSPLRADSGVVEVGQRPVETPENDQVDDMSVDDFFGDLNDEDGEHVEPARAEDVSGVRAQSRALASEFDQEIDQAVSRLGDEPPGTRPMAGAALRVEPFSKTDSEVTRVLSRAELAAVVGDAERKTGNTPNVKTQKNLNEVAQGSPRPVKPIEKSANPVEIFDREELTREMKRLPSIAKGEAQINDEQIRKQRAKLAGVKVPELPRLKKVLYATPAASAPPVKDRLIAEAPPVPKKEAAPTTTTLQKLGAWWERNNPFKQAS